MIISNTHRAIFIHVMKTGGTSIAQLLAPQLRWNDLILGGTTFGEAIQHAYHEQFGLHKHARAAQVRLVIGEETWASYRSFTVVRHPYDRFMSFYNWKRRQIPDARPDSLAVKWPATKAFLESRSVSEFMRHDLLLAAPIAKPQVDWVNDESGRRIVDFVGRFEDLPAFARAIGARFGIDPSLLARHNASERDRSPGSVLESEDDYRFLHALYRPDFEAFGYDPAVRL